MSGNRMARPTLKSAGKTRLTTIRDILREIEEDEAREREENAKIARSRDGVVTISQNSSSPRSQNSTDSGVSGTTGKRIVVRVPSAGVVKTNKKAREEPADNQSRTSVEVNKLPDAKCKQIDANDKVTSSVTRFADSPEHFEDNDSNNNASYGEIWNNFEDEGIHFLPKLMTERGSVPFHKCMDEMKHELKVTKRKQRREGIKAAIKMTMMLNKNNRRDEDVQNEQGEAVESSSSEEDTDSEDDDGKTKSFRKMSRGWKILNLALKEQHLQKKRDEGTDGWNLLSHTINQMTNEEKARQELYERYLYKPNSWAEGFVNPPKFLQDRLTATSSTVGLANPQGATRYRPQTAQARMSNHNRPVVDRDSIKRPNNHMACRSVTNTSHISRLNRPKSGHV